MQTAVQVEMTLDQMERRIRRAAQAKDGELLGALAGRLRGMAWSGKGNPDRAKRLLGMVRRAMQDLPGVDEPAEKQRE